MNEELYKRLSGLRLDTYAVDQGLMLNRLVNYLTGAIVWQDDNGKVNANDIVNAIELIHNQCKLVNN